MFLLCTDFLNRSRARTTSEMMEVDDKIMPLPNFRVKPKKWKSSSSIQYTAQQQQQHINMHMGPPGVHDNRSIPASRRFCSGGLGSVAPAVTAAALDVTAAGGARVFTPEEERRRRALLLMRRQGLLIAR